MEFLGMLLINVFLGVIFYLIITLKLEKSASDFREKKLWEEMDKMIQEFNATAERNISILEKKIRIMRALLDKSGDMKKIDFTIEDEDDSESDAVETKTSAAEEVAPAAAVSARPERATVVDRAPNRYANRKIASLLKEAFFSVLDVVMDYMNGMRQRNAERAAARMQAQSGGALAEEIPSPGPGFIEKDFEEIESKISSQLEGEQKPDRPSEDDIMMIIGDGKDRRSTISLLHRKGCPEEEISHYMGIPVGEVRLILNLTDSI